MPRATGHGPWTTGHLRDRKQKGESHGAGKKAHCRGDACVARTREASSTEESRRGKSSFARAKAHGAAGCRGEAYLARTRGEEASAVAGWHAAAEGAGSAAAGERGLADLVPGGAVGPRDREVLYRAVPVVRARVPAVGDATQAQRRGVCVHAAALYGASGQSGQAPRSDADRQVPTLPAGAGAEAASLEERERGPAGRGLECAGIQVL